MTSGWPRRRPQDCHRLTRHPEWPAAAARPDRPVRRGCRDRGAAAGPSSAAPASRKSTPRQPAASLGAPRARRSDAKPWSRRRADEPRTTAARARSRRSPAGADLHRPPPGPRRLEACASRSRCGRVGGPEGRRLGPGVLDQPRRRCTSGSAGPVLEVATGRRSPLRCRADRRSARAAAPGGGPSCPAPSMRATTDEREVATLRPSSTVWRCRRPRCAPMARDAAARATPERADLDHHCSC